METKAFRVTHRFLKWEYPYIFAPSAGAAIREVIAGLDSEKRSKDLFHFRNWSAVEMAEPSNMDGNASACAPWDVAL